MNCYGRIREKKLTASDMNQMTCQTTKQELLQALDTENRRVNIDSAKKRAVVQHMDYEGFRQMVLGAHLYRLKSRELKDFSIATDRIMNPAQTTFNNVQTLPTAELNPIDTEAILKHMRSLQCNGFREFRAAFSQRYRKPIDEQVLAEVDMQRHFQSQVRLVKAQTAENWKKIVSIDFQVSYFLDLLDIFELQLNETDQICFIVQLMHDLSLIKDFQFQVPKFLKKSEKERITAFLQTLNSVDLTESGVTEDFHAILVKVNSYYSF